MSKSVPGAPFFKRAKVEKELTSSRINPHYPAVMGMYSCGPVQLAQAPVTVGSCQLIGQSLPSRNNTATEVTFVLF